MSLERHLRNRARTTLKMVAKQVVPNTWVWVWARLSDKGGWLNCWLQDTVLQGQSPLPAAPFFSRPGSCLSRLNVDPLFWVHIWVVTHFGLLCFRGPRFVHSFSGFHFALQACYFFGLCLWLLLRTHQFPLGANCVLDRSSLSCLVLQGKPKECFLCFFWSIQMLGSLLVAFTFWGMLKE